MKIYVDKKPNKCQDCLFCQQIEKIGDVKKCDHPVSTTPYNPEVSNIYIEKNTVYKCTLLNIELPKEIREQTYLGICPLKELNEGE